MLKTASLLISLCILGVSFAQRGKDNSYTVSAASTQLNAYTNATADIAAGATTISVASNTLTNAFFTAGLGQGDLVMIIQMQGATMDIDVTATASWGGHYTTPNGHIFDWGATPDLWGNVTAYNNAGKFELAEVRSVTGTTSITFQCGLVNSYTNAGHVQVIRVPRLQNLTLNANMTLVPAMWNGTTGGVIALEVNGTLTLNANSKILATGYGFRGGALDNTSNGAVNAASAGNQGYSGSDSSYEGAEKGEGIGGFYAEYDALYSRYCKSAPANGGGGGNNHNAGGGGGSNVGTGAYTGKGVPAPGYAAAWNLEAAGLATASSSGGGRGGYSNSETNRDALTVGPNNSLWTGDQRRNEGGLGGHTLTYDVTRMFAGGGGGAGEQNSNQGGAGGRGGGIVYLKLYGIATGTGGIEANGANGVNANSAGLTATANSVTKYGNDGAGGAGAGGAIVISNGNAIPASVTLTANGGNGGNQVLSMGNFASPTMEADGPGGGGAGGMIALTSGTPAQSVAGGNNGTTNSTHLTEFPPNGATRGASGMSSIVHPFFDIIAANVNICTNNTATLTASVSGTLPAGAAITWYSAQFGGTTLGTGASYTTPVLTATTTYYVGTCPGTFRIPVIVTVGGPTIGGTASITNVTCSTPGSITGLTTTGGVPSVTITWNGVVTPTMNLTGASAGTYNVLVTDGIGCTATAGPYTITSTGGPTINTTNMVVTNQSCLGNDGSITGITTTGTITGISWNSGAYSTLNINNLPAGNYTLQVTDNNSCTATVGPITVGSNPGPVINTTGMAIINETCGSANGSITGITATGNSLTYEWNGVTSASANLSNVPAGSYTLVVEDNLGCTATAGPFTITNTPGPVLNLTNVVVTNEHCGQGDGSITGITMSGGAAPISISWNSGAYNTLNISNLSSGTYNLLVSDNNGCTAMAGPYTIINEAGPVISTTNMVITPESCSGNDGSITGITATGTGLTYEWNLAPSATIDLTGAAAGYYVLQVEDAHNCTAISGPHIISGAVVMTLDSTNLAITASGCTAATGAINGLQVNGGVNPQISWATGQSTANIANLIGGTYTITVTDDQNCNVTASFVVPTANGPSITNVSVSPATCGQTNGSIVVTASGGTGTLNYSADNGSFQSSNTFNTMAPATYDVVVEDAGGCQAVTTATVANQASPVITSVTFTDPSCGNADGSLTINSSGGTGTLQYSIDNGATFTSTATFTNLLAGSYDIVVADQNNCQATNTTLLSNQNGPVIDAGPDQTVCLGEQVTLSGSGGVLYNWDNGVQDNVAFIPTTTTTYTVVGQDAAGCQGTDQVTVTVTQGMAIDIVPSVTQGCGPLAVTFQNNTANSGDCLWQFSNGLTLSGCGNQTVTFTQPGCYDLTMSVLSTSGCTGTQTFPGIVCVSDAPEAAFTPTPNTITTDSPVSTMVNHSTGATSYQWSFGDANMSTETTPVHTFPDVEGTYIVSLTAVNADGCTDVAQAIVTVEQSVVYYIPNTFTPDDNEFNQTFQPVFTSGYDQYDFNMQIFNRWGEVVFETNDDKIGWDGTYKGTLAQEGAYTYRIEFKISKNDARRIVTGHVMLLK